ncbi:MAG: TlpA disulfide reductase family protein [Erysipelotrichaceae bacterium]
MKKLLIVLMMAIMVVGCTKPNVQANKPEDKKKNYYEFEVEDESGKKYTNKDFEGQYLYIKFWTSWCPYCVDGLPALNEIATSDKFKVISIISTGYNDEKNRMDFLKWFKEKKLDNIEIYFDINNKAYSNAGISSFPSQLFINKQGEVMLGTAGSLPNETIFNVFDQIVGLEGKNE